jgi:solute:Na+ symporter, SSS family
VLGWAAEMVYGTWKAYGVPVAGQAHSHFGGSTASIIGHTMYIAIAALALNLAVSIVLTAIFRLARMPAGADETRPEQYVAEPETAPAERVPAATVAGS